MLRYFFKRLLQMIPILLAVSLIVFFMISFSPGDPAKIALGMNAKQEAVDAFKAEYGLDKPVVEQYFRYMGGVLTGGFGKSYTTKQYVADMIAIRLPATLIIAFGSMLLTYLVTIPIGVLLAVKQNSWFDHAFRVIALGMGAIPSFWLALLLIMFFSVRLGWLPSNGFDTPLHWVLPLIASCFAGWGSSSRYIRMMVLDTIRQDYVRTARAKGCKEGTVLYRHALRNALMPLVTSIGMSIGTFFGGSVILEQIFGINGMGNMLLEALRQKDIPTIMAGVLISATLIAVGNLIADLCYGLVDPRIRSMYKKTKKQMRKEVAVLNGQGK